MFQTKNVSMVLTCSFYRVSISGLIRGAFLLLFVLVLAACEPSTSTPTQAATVPASSTSVPVVTITPVPVSTTAAGYPIKVYFSKLPDSTNKFDAVFPVDRYSPTNAVATYSIQLLIAGPTASERSAGYFSELGSILSGSSSCSAFYGDGGPDFTLTLNMRGSKAQEGTATLHFCRTTSSPGIGADARIMAQINATLKQFSNIKDVVVLTQAGNCFADGSGLDNCLR